MFFSFIVCHVGGEGPVSNSVGGEESISNSDGGEKSVSTQSLKVLPL